MDKWEHIFSDIVDVTSEEKDVLKLQALIMTQINFMAHVTNSAFDDILDNMRRIHDAVEDNLEMIKKGSV